MTVKMLDDLKQLGFLYATRAGISIGIDDLVTPDAKKTLVAQADKDVIEVEKQYRDGVITNGERYNKVIAIWSEVTDKVAKEMFLAMDEREKGAKEANPILIMSDSGARGTAQQIRQLAGMRGLMAKPSGEIIETPIRSNFREGLNVLQYFISTHGARKGLADTALKTADSGYLTRRLVDVAQDVIVSEPDCGTLKGISASAIVEGGEEIESLRDRIIGRTALEDVIDPVEGAVIVASNDEINEDLAQEIQRSGVQRVRIRSVLTCESRRGVCIKCYGRNLATGKAVDIGEAVGVIAAQSIGEQLTMRTFHIGGTARLEESSKHEARMDGTIKYVDLNVVKNRRGEITAMNRNGALIIIDERGREVARHQIVYGAHIHVENGARVKEDQLLATWDPFTFAILTEVAGTVKYQDLKEGVTVEEEVDEVTGQSRVVVKDSPDEKRQPRLEVRHGNKVLKTYQMPVRANLMVHDGDEVAPGDVIAKIPRETTKTKDITGGLPRVVELFEARKPRETAVMSEIDGTVKLGAISKGKRRLIVVGDDGEEREYDIPRGTHINVQEGDRVRAGEALMDGPLNPHDILRVLGMNRLQEYLVNEIQEVYRLQGVNINDKHIEVIVRQMLRWVRISDVGDTDFLLDEQVDRFRFTDENDRVVGTDGEPAKAEPLLLGITKASLSTDSFISAASFQETTRVLTEAAISGRVDYLRGLKENVIMGRLIPAGTGMDFYRNVKVERDTTAEAAREEEQRESLSDLLGGVEPPAVVPAREKVVAAAEGDAAADADAGDDE
jgi:DNA-directed RNA polymerase subunit beta'